MSNYAIKVLSCRRGRISYLSAETLQGLVETLEAEDLRPARRAARLTELGHTAADNGYPATAAELFCRAINIIAPADGDMQKMNIRAYERHTLLRAAAGLDKVWRHMGCRHTAHLRETLEFLRELHYVRLGIDYDEILSELEDYEHYE